MKKVILSKLKEAAFSVLPLSLLIVIISFAVAPMDKWTLISFIISVAILVLGMGLYSIGADSSIEPIGDHIGANVSQSKKIWLILIVSLVIGVFITIAEPDLVVLSSQLPIINKWTLILTIAAGVGILLLIATLRIFTKIPLNIVLIAVYGVVFLLLIFVPDSFIPLAFDSGGVTTGPITVPFIMALGIGISATVGGKNAEENSFGVVGICTAGPVIAILVLGIFFKVGDATHVVSEQAIYSFATLIKVYASAFLVYFKEVALALAPIALIFFIFQFVSLKLPKKAVLRIIIGLLYTYVGLSIFLAGVNVAFMSAGNAIGQGLATVNKYLLVPVGMAVGTVLVLAEPAVHVLNRQVENITGGTIKRKVMLIVLSISVSLALGLSMLRIVVGFSILYILIPGYVLALVLTFFVPKTFTAIAFDSGAVATGPMTATFLLPFAIGACVAVGGNIMKHAFGAIAVITLTPLLTVQILGLIYTIKSKRIKQIYRDEISKLLATEGQIIDLLEQSATKELSNEQGATKQVVNGQMLADNGGQNE